MSSENELKPRYKEVIHLLWVVYSMLEGDDISAAVSFCIGVLQRDRQVSEESIGLLGEEVEEARARHEEHVRQIDVDIKYLRSWLEDRD